MPTKVIFDHDGGVDDLLSLMLLLTMPQVELLAVTITPADCYLSDATLSTLKILSMFDRHDIPVAQGQYHGINSFPADWRAQPKICNALPRMLSQAYNPKQVVEVDASQLIVDLLKQHKDVTLLMTGPCSHLAMALDHTTQIKNSIRSLVWMGGAVDVGGNVAMHNHDKSAEWNAFWDPVSVAKVFASGISVKLISLDATNFLPVNMDFLSQLAKQMAFPLSDLACQFWATTVNSIPSYEYTYYMWDVLATSVVGMENAAVGFETMELAVSANEPNAGQTYRQPGNGQWIDVAKTVDAEAVLNYVLKQFSR